MITITAIIRSKTGHEETMKMALLEVAQHVNENEPDTVDFYISQDINNPCVFTTYERFASKAAMEAHNGSTAVGIFFEKAQPILDGDVTLVTAREVSQKFS
ncbi:MAG: antibiotic biosynthesis monooxygenase [Paracoccaceae bacterium]|jgi:quinol monooxygenase YgiN|nr:antibiotic biosynthesis monooxygenase [Pseudomonadota bacterium]MDA0851332.1 antibiotic biosynthesis monooxygenase [Pseudomonadota bacterium]